MGPDVLLHVRYSFVAIRVIRTRMPSGSRNFQLLYKNEFVADESFKFEFIKTFEKENCMRRRKIIIRGIPFICWIRMGVIKGIRNGLQHGEILLGIMNNLFK